MGLLGIGSIISSSMNAKSQNNLQVQALRQQKKENELAREYNLNLAKQQNQWNIEQWNREQAALEAERGYNTPAAQKARLQAAGLNADLMYGQGGVSNVSTSGAASAAPMTAGAPATPMDWSSLANRKTIGSAIMDSLNIQQMRANVKKTEAEAKEKGLEADILDNVGLETAELNREYVREGVNKLRVEAEGIDYSNTEKEIQNAFYKAYRERVVDNMLTSLEASTQMTKNALKEDIETLTLRIAGVNAENSRLQRMSDFTTDEWRLVFDVVRELLSFIK